MQITKLFKIRVAAVEAIFVVTSPRTVCKMMGINLDSKTVPDHKVPALARVPNCTAVPDHKVPRYTREFRRTAIAACAENTTAMQPCAENTTANGRSDIRARRRR